jgi:hypothetical protein
MATTARSVAVVIAVTSAIVTSCSGGLARGQTCADSSSRPNDCLRWAGFHSIPGLDLVSATREGGLDTVVRFTIRGGSADIDRALALADFDAPFSVEALSGSQAASHVELNRVSDARAATDSSWTNVDGDTLHRQAARGRLAGSDDEILYVIAFTT